MSRPLRLAAALLLGMCGLVGCTSGDKHLTGQGSTSHNPAQIAARWSAFPVDAEPRPIVLAGPDIVGPGGAFPDGDTKLAFTDHRFELTAPLPRPPSKFGGFPVISAKTAFAHLSQPAGKVGAHTAYRLRVTHVALGMAMFDTDRGPRALPAWLFDLHRLTDPAAVLAVASPPLFALPGVGYDTDRSAEASDDGAMLTVWFTGTGKGTGPCTSDYTLKTYETDHAVVASVIQHRNGLNETAKPSGRGIVCNLVGYTRQAQATLARPLGNRVVLHDTGTVLMVGRCSSKAGRTTASCTKVDE